VATALMTVSFSPDHPSKEIPMRYFTIVCASLCLLGIASTAHAQKDFVDCGRESLAAAVNNVKDKEKGLTIQFTGVCHGPVVVKTDGLTLKGVGTAVIDGAGRDALTVAGASRVTLDSFEVRNGLNGIVAIDGAHVAMRGVNAHDNAVFGVTLQTTSSAVLSGVTANHNGVFGLDLQTGSAATVTGDLTASNNQVFGINVNGSSITFAQAHVVANGNALGIQIATGANAFINDSATDITANDNFSVGLTIVSGAHMVSFGGTINASGNPVAGVSVNSKAGLDLDAASTLNVTNNGDGLMLQDASVMTVFNTPQFSGVPGFSTVNASHNTRTGVRVLTGSTLTLVNQAKMVSTQNGTVGVQVDDAVSVTLVNSTMTGNAAKDIQLTFGTRADLQMLTFGSYSCDGTVLVRGTPGILCPH
jgi:hypothetical protein